jgi:hypothetical protein
MMDEAPPPPTKKRKKGKKGEKKEKRKIVSNKTISSIFFKHGDRGTLKYLSTHLFQSHSTPVPIDQTVHLVGYNVT